MDEQKKHDNLGRALAEHAGGMVIIGSAMAGVGAVVGMRRGGSIKGEATLAGILGIIGSLGFGRTVYAGIFGQNRHASVANATPETWVEKVRESDAAKSAPPRFRA